MWELKFLFECAPIPQWMRILIHILPHWLSSVLQFMQIYWVKKLYYKLLQICISVVTNELEHASIYLLIICISSVNCLSILYAYSLLDCCLFLIDLKACIITFDINSFITLQIFFSKSIACLFFLAVFIYTVLHDTKVFLCSKPCQSFSVMASEFCVWLRMLFLLSGDFIHIYNLFLFNTFTVLLSS